VVLSLNSSRRIRSQVEIAQQMANHESARTAAEKPLTTATDGPWRERLWRQKPARLDTFVRMRMDSAS
jgi:hypothetical protein